MLPKALKKLIEEFSKLPGIGNKSAQRLAMYLLRTPDDRVRGLAEAVGGLKEGIIFCSECWNVADRDPCGVCSDASRDRSKICVVEEVLDAAAIEKTGDYDGLYHVLHGALSPVDGVGVDELKISELISRVKRSAKSEDAPSETVKIKEIILATNPSLEGEATALYIQKALSGVCHEDGAEVCVTRIARGLPTGGHIEYSDDITLSRAMKGRGGF